MKNLGAATGGSGNDMATSVDAEGRDGARPRYIHVWDIWIRLGHWLLVALVTLLWWSADTHRWSIHIIAGEGTLGLISWRLLWGFRGTTTARFRQFLKPPTEVIAYARTLGRRRGHPVIGHNPMGGWSVVAILALLFALAISGLLAQNLDGLGSGPFAAYLSYRAAALAAKCHQAFFQLLVLLIVAHVCAIAFYMFYKRQNLLRAMLTGNVRLVDRQ